MGCLKEAERAGRGGGSISVFFGDAGIRAGGCTGCTGDRRPGNLRGDGGANEGAEFFDADVAVFTAGILSAPGRMILWRLVGGKTGFTAVESVRACFFPGDVSCRDGEGSRGLGLLAGG